LEKRCRNKVSKLDPIFLSFPCGGGSHPRLPPLFLSSDCAGATCQIEEGTGGNCRRRAQEAPRARMASLLAWNSPPEPVFLLGGSGSACIDPLKGMCSQPFDSKCSSSNRESNASFLINQYH